MLAKEIRITFDGFDSSDSLKDYTMEKLQKYERLLENATSGDVTFKNNGTNRGVKDDFVVQINISLPQSRISVDEIGDNVYALVDLATDIVFRQLNKYSKRSHSDYKIATKMIETNIEMQTIEEDLGDIEDQYADYTPVIAKRKKLENNAPMEEAEAIEEMELRNAKQFLFKRKDGKFCMVTLENGEYVIVESADEI